MLIGFQPGIANTETPLPRFSAKLNGWPDEITSITGLQGAARARAALAAAANEPTVSNGSGNGCHPTTKLSDNANWIGKGQRNGRIRAAIRCQKLPAKPKHVSPWMSLNRAFKAEDEHDYGRACIAMADVGLLTDPNSFEHRVLLALQILKYRNRPNPESEAKAIHDLNRDIVALCQTDVLDRSIQNTLTEDDHWLVRNLQSLTECHQLDLFSTPPATRKGVVYHALLEEAVGDLDNAKKLYDLAAVMQQCPNSQNIFEDPDFIQLKKEGLDFDILAAHQHSNGAQDHTRLWG